MQEYQIFTPAGQLSPHETGRNIQEAPQDKEKANRLSREAQSLQERGKLSWTGLRNLWVKAQARDTQSRVVRRAVLLPAWNLYLDAVRTRKGSAEEEKAAFDGYCKLAEEVWFDGGEAASDAKLAYWDMKPGNGPAGTKALGFDAFSPDKAELYRELAADHPVSAAFGEFLPLAEGCADGTGTCLESIHAFFAAHGDMPPESVSAACDALGDALSRNRTGAVSLGRKWYGLWAAFAAAADFPGEDGPEVWGLLASLFDALPEKDCGKLCEAYMDLVKKMKSKELKPVSRKVLRSLGEILLETCQRFDAATEEGAPLDYWLILGEAIKGDKRWAYCFNIFDKGDKQHTASVGADAKVLSRPPAEVFQASCLMQEEKYKNIQEAGTWYCRQGSQKTIVHTWMKEMKFVAPGK